jgi:hypothetical protein
MLKVLPRTPIKYVIHHTLVILYEDPALDRDENVKQKRDDNISDNAK